MVVSRFMNTSKPRASWMVKLTVEGEVMEFLVMEPPRKIQSPSAGQVVVVTTPQAAGERVTEKGEWGQGKREKKKGTDG